MISTKYIIILFAAFSVCNLNAQDCSNYQKENCKHVEPYFTPSGLSSNLLLEPAKECEVILPLRSDEEYYISFCTNKKCRPINFKIIDLNNPEVVVYDNSSDKYIEEINFENQLARKLKIIITISQPTKATEETSFCVGMYVGHKRMK